jgi:hypothetical protein
MADSMDIDDGMDKREDAAATAKRERHNINAHHSRKKAKEKVNHA